MAHKFNGKTAADFPDTEFRTITLKRKTATATFFGEGSRPKLKFARTATATKMFKR